MPAPKKTKDDVAPKQVLPPKRGVLAWIARALTDNGMPSSTRLNSFIVMCVLSSIAIMLACKMVFGDGEYTTISNALDGICLSLAGLGGVSYIGGRIADRQNRATKHNGRSHDKYDKYNEYEC